VKRRFTDSLVFLLQEGCVRAYRRVRPLGIWIGLWCLLLTGGVFAAEEPERFLAQLRARGYFDTASNYLEFIATSDLVDDAFKQSIPFEQAVTLKERAARTADRVEREQLLSEAIGAFQDFATANPNSMRAADVRLETANVYRLMARLTMAGAKRPGADRNALEQKAAKYYSDAMAEAVKAEVTIQDQRKKVRGELAAVRKAAGNVKDPNRKVGKQERDLIALRDKLRDDWIKSEYTQVTTTNLQASVYERESAEWKAAVEKATKAYEEMFFKHDVRLVGLICRVQQMRCLMELGRFDEALDCLPDVTDYEESDSPQLRKVWFDSFAIEIECRIGKQEYQQAIQLSRTRLSKEEQQLPQAKKVLYLRAKAALAFVGKLGPDKKKEKKKLLAEAKNVLKDLVESQSIYQTEATEMLASLGVAVDQEEEEQGDPQDFDTAFRQALAAMQRWGKLSKQVAEAQGDEKKQLQLKLAEVGDRAFILYRLAVSFAKNDTNADKIRGIQKGLCYLYFSRGDYLRAAVLGEFLANAYPGSRDAKFGTDVAINAWLKLYGEAGEERDFEEGKIKRLAQGSIKRHPKSSQAATARGYLLTFAIQNGAVDAAWEYLKDLPQSAPKLNKSQILVGQLFWNRYSQNRRLSDDARPSSETLDTDRDRAEALLTRGLEGYQDAQAVDYAAAQGAYILAMLMLGKNEPQRSIEILESPAYGPLTLINAKHPEVMMRPDYVAKVYRLALRASIGALPLYPNEQEKQDALVDKAFDIVNQLEKAVGTDGDAESRLTKIYVDLGKDLELQIQGLSETGNDAAKKSLVDAFEMFLGQIEKSPAPTVAEELAKMKVAQGDATEAQMKTAKENVAKKSYRRLIWIGETYFTLGNSNRNSDAKAAKQYYDEAAKIYNRILKRKLYSTPRQRTTIRLRLADCYRGVRDYKEALDQLVEVLAEKESNLTAQQQAAETLYEAGEENCGDYVKSILGDEEDEDTGNNIIWGWKKLAQQVNEKEKYADYFFRAKLYGIRARRMYAECLDSGDETKKRKLLAAAKGNLLQIYNQFPRFGGTEFKAEFESEMKQVQSALGEEQVGFPVPRVEAVDEPVAVSGS
jgi:hypothetical protein